MKLFRGISGHRERSRKTNLEGMGMSDTDEDAEEKKKTSVDGNREKPILILLKNSQVYHNITKTTEILKLQYF